MNLKNKLQKTPLEDYKALQKSVAEMPFKNKIKTMEVVKKKNIEDIFSKNNKNESSRTKRKSKKPRD